MADISDADIPNDDSLGTITAEMREEARRNNEANGLAPKGLTRNATDADAKAWVDAAVVAVTFASHPDEVREWGEINQKSLDVLAEHHFEEWLRLTAALDEVENATAARIN